MLRNLSILTLLSGKSMNHFNLEHWLTFSIFDLCRLFLTYPINNETKSLILKSEVLLYIRSTSVLSFGVVLHLVGNTFV